MFKPGKGYTTTGAKESERFNKQRRYSRRREFGPEDIVKAYEKSNKLKQFTAEIRLDA